MSELVTQRLPLFLCIYQVHERRTSSSNWFTFLFLMFGPLSMWHLTLNKLFKCKLFYFNEATIETKRKRRREKRHENKKILYSIELKIIFIILFAVSSQSVVKVCLWIIYFMNLTFSRFCFCCCCPHTYKHIEFQWANVGSQDQKANE